MSDAPLRVAIAGAAGRMGRALVQAGGEDEGVVLSAAFEARGHALVGADAGSVAGVGALGVTISDAPDEAVQGCDVVIDFTRPQATLAHLRACAAAGVRAVVGTTGFSVAERAEIDTLAERVALVLAPNMSVGVNLCFKLVEIAAQTLGNGVDVEVIEAHHRHKVDAPSGTAVRMGEVVAAALGRDLASCAVYGREGHTGERQRETIGFETIRAGDIVGEHTVMFADTGERVEITHRASSRMNFARGALRAAHWISGNERGCFDMLDVLGLR